MPGVSYPTFRYLRVLGERRRLAIKRIFWITSAIWFYLIYQHWTPPLDCEVASLTCDHLMAKAQAAEQADSVPKH